MSLARRRRGSLAAGAAARARTRVTTLLADAPTLSFQDRAGIAAREIAGEVMAAAPRPSDLVALAAEAASLAESLAEEGRKMAPPARPIACRAGCSHCCHLSVQAAPAEVLRLAQHIRDRFSSAERASLLERLRQAAAMTKDARLAAASPCPLLKDARCTVYEARPLSCRGLESMDADACRRASQGENVRPPVYAMRWAIFNRVASGLIAGTADAGRERESLDLSPALVTALEEPDAARRWLAGEPLFARCRWPTAQPPTT
ncbi:MAG: YkgJ family cysteine cluster protein [Alphaproteobacteria bacterium]